MRKQLFINSVILIFFVSMLTNTFGWSFNDKVFAHELDHHYRASLFSADPQKHIDLHVALGDDDGVLDAATHLCLHAAGQFIPLFFNAPLFIISTSADKEALASFISVTAPEFILDSLFRPPKNFAS
ncbi:hypothetical protein SAMN05421863_10048 [Nitrosomonas communis]|uniref:Uncharacterized protein n=2 Tax=Nitrosomonas communis TaxID=44574 RepID=A0A1I4KDN5_9PROT|nr:hypothetical protein SAMN05421863_10048 [Nitrosomonas communis]